MKPYLPDVVADDNVKQNLRIIKSDHSKNRKTQTKTIEIK